MCSDNSREIKNIFMYTKRACTTGDFPSCQAVHDLKTVTGHWKCLKILAYRIKAHKWRSNEFTVPVNVEFTLLR